MNPTGLNDPKWPVKDMKVGDSFVIPWLTGPNGDRHGSQKVIHVTVWRYAKKSGFRLARRAEHAGIRVTRLA